MVTTHSSARGRLAKSRREAVFRTSTITEHAAFGHAGGNFPWVLEPAKRRGRGARNFHNASTSGKWYPSREGRGILEDGLRAEELVSVMGSAFHKNSRSGDPTHGIQASRGLEARRSTDRAFSSSATSKGEATDGVPYGSVA